MNGCVDLLSQEFFYPQMAYNNTYGLQLINETFYQSLVQSWEKPGGCRDKIINCQNLANIGDPNFYGNNDTVNAVCADADNYCSNDVEGFYYEDLDAG